MMSELRFDDKLFARVVRDFSEAYNSLDEMANCLKCSRANLENIMNGKSLPTVDFLMQFCNAWDWSLSDFVFEQAARDE